MSQGLVSVIIPAYKRADTIERSVRSAIGQTYPDIEIIVVDDHSCDDTPDIVSAIDDERITFLSHPDNRGGNATRRTAIEAAQGRWLAFLDADDVWFPEKLQAQLDRLDELTDATGEAYEMAYTWYESELPDGTTVPARQPRVEGREIPELYTSNLIGTFSTVLVSRDAHDRAGGLDPSLPSCQDWEFYLRVNRVTGIACVPRTLARYWRGDQDPTRISSSRERVAAGHVQMYRRMSPYLRDLPEDEAVAARRYLIETVANQAATAKVAAMALGIPPEQWSPGAARFVAHMLARSVRRR